MPPFLSLGLFLTPHSSKPHARLTNSRGRRSAPCLSHSRRYRPPQLIPTACYIFRGVRLLNPKFSSSQTHSSHTLSPSTNTTSVHLCLCLLGFNSCLNNKILDLPYLRKHRLESIISNTLLHIVFFFYLSQPWLQCNSSRASASTWTTTSACAPRPCPALLLEPASLLPPPLTTPSLPHLDALLPMSSTSISRDPSLDTPTNLHLPQLPPCPSTCLAAQSSLSMSQYLSPTCFLPHLSRSLTPSTPTMRA